MWESIIFAAIDEELCCSWLVLIRCISGMSLIKEMNECHQSDSYYWYSGVEEFSMCYDHHRNDLMCPHSAFAILWVWSIFIQDIINKTLQKLFWWILLQSLKESCDLEKFHGLRTFYENLPKSNDRQWGNFMQRHPGLEVCMLAISMIVWNLCLKYAWYPNVWGIESLI